MIDFAAARPKRRRAVPPVSAVVLTVVDGVRGRRGESLQVTRTGAPIAKISTPRLFGVVARERLFVRLDENRGRPLIWIEGPPGAGKTALVASYLEARGITALWYQVDQGD